MDYVINKGMAGLGNRFQSLGWALDVAAEHGASLVVDWADTTWRLGFDRYFTLQGIRTTALAAVPDGLSVNPESWRGAWREQTGSARGSKEKVRRVDPDCDAHVVCTYLHKYSDRLCGCVRPTAEVYRAKANALKGIGRYNAYHIRHTDKRTENWREWIGKARARQDATGLPSLVVTDGVRVKRRAIECGLLCPSDIEEPNHKEGLHHKQVGDVRKHELNLSVVVDLWIAIGAREFTGCCERSTFSAFAERMRNINRR